MDAEAPPQGIPRTQAFLRAVLRTTRVSLIGLGLVVAADILFAREGPRFLLASAGLLVILVGTGTRFRGAGWFVSILTVVIRLWSVLAAAFLWMEAIFVAC